MDPRGPCFLPFTDSFVFSVSYPGEEGDPYRDLAKCASILDTSVYDAQKHRYFQNPQQREQLLVHRAQNTARLGCFKVHYES